MARRTGYENEVMDGWINDIPIPVSNSEIVEIVIDGKVIKIFRKDKDNEYRQFTGKIETNGLGGVRGNP